MKGDRLRVQVESDYTRALGLALFVFARLEWDAVWCIEKMAPGTLGPVSDRTAGGIAKELTKQVELLNLPAGHELPLAAAEFARLVRIRNGICHGKPGTDHDGGQRLFRDGSAWTVESIDEAADEFTACQIRLNDLLYGYFQHPTS